MSQTTSPATRSFHCVSCRGEIQIPFDLPPTTAPCPHCGTRISSPAPPVVFADRSPLEQPVLPPSDPGDSPAPTGIAPAASEEAVLPAAPVPSPLAEASLPKQERSRPKQERGLHPAIPFLAAVVVIVGVLMILVVLKRKDPDPDPPVVADTRKNVPAPLEREVSEEGGRERFLEQGWKTDASNTLAGFLQARSSDEKARHVIGGDVLMGEMEKFYTGVSEIDESDTPVNAFSHQQLDIMDRRRGLFLMRFERPSQLKMSEFFRPVAPLEIQHDLKEPGLLFSAFSARERFAMEPVRVMAFFKEADGKLLLDWKVYTQTKYRIFKHFISSPRPGAGGVFRVMVRETMPVAKTGTNTNAGRTFSLSDPAFARDRVTVTVLNDELPGRILSELAWINIPDRRDQNRYATVRLSWTSAPENQIHLDEVICWEFLGLGGEAGNADLLGEDVAGGPGSGKAVPFALGEATNPVSIREGEPGEKIPPGLLGDEGGSDSSGDGKDEEGNEESPKGPAAP